MTNYQHQDILGNEIKLDDACVYPSHNGLKIGIINKINPKMISIVPVGKKYFDRKYPNDVYILSDSKLSLYLLKNTK